MLKPSVFALSIDAQIPQCEGKGIDCLVSDLIGCLVIFIGCLEYYLIDCLGFCLIDCLGFYFMDCLGFYLIICLYIYFLFFWYFLHFRQRYAVSGVLPVPNVS